MPKNITPEENSQRIILDELSRLQTLYTETSQEIGRCMHGMLEMLSNQSYLGGLLSRFMKESEQSHLLLEDVVREIQAIIARHEILNMEAVYASPRDRTLLN